MLTQAPVAFECMRTRTLPPSLPPSLPKSIPPSLSRAHGKPAGKVFLSFSRKPVALQGQQAGMQEEHGRQVEAGKSSDGSCMASALEPCYCESTHTDMRATNFFVTLSRRGQCAAEVAMSE